jgi:murein L,D-transpeptidase YafK
MVLVCGFRFKVCGSMKCGLDRFSAVSPVSADRGGGSGIENMRRLNSKPVIATYLLFALAIAPAASHGRGLPASPRSREAVSRQRTALGRALSERDLAWGAPMLIRIFKSEKRLEVWLKGSRYRLFKCYPVCTFGGKGIGPKTRQGDGRAPEGIYRVRPEQMNPFSRFYLAFDLGYPNTHDRAHGYTGSALMVHGGCVSIGCFAMTDRSMEEIYTLAHAALNNGQPYFMVQIFPFEMTAENMKRYRPSKWFDFWSRLKVEYDRFQDQNTAGVTGDAGDPVL